jgi:hypothetical protein
MCTVTTLQRSPDIVAITPNGSFVVTTVYPGSGASLIHAANTFWPPVLTGNATTSSPLFDNLNCATPTVPCVANDFADTGIGSLVLLCCRAL